MDIIVLFQVFKYMQIGKEITVVKFIKLVFIYLDDFTLINDGR